MAARGGLGVNVAYPNVNVMYRLSTIQVAALQPNLACLSTASLCRSWKRVAGLWALLAGFLFALLWLEFI